MKQFQIIILLYLILFSCNNSVEHLKNKNNTSDFNLNWQFYLSQENENANAITNDKFNTINLPHDWVIKGKFDSTLVKDAFATGYIPSKGYGFYKKTFDLPFDENNINYILFDGVYNNTTTEINGHKLGFHPYGYSPFYYNITPYLNQYGNQNVITVKVDHTRYADSRWYTGAGIYRNVELITKSKLHIPIWGTYITTPKVSKKNANIKFNINLKNDFSSNENFILSTKIMDLEGHEVALKEKEINIEPNSNKEIIQNISIKNPKLWGVKNPNLYKASISIIKNNEVIDVYNSKFGIRTIKFDANTGFFLNGENMKIKGVCLHHDGGLVGAAVPKGVWSRKLQILKDAGVNAIRISHNPASSEFLDLCDEMGFLVQDELFDEWDNPKDKRFNQNESKSTDYITRGYGEHFQEWAKKDLNTIILSHRNHPSIFQWSIGNEIEWTYPRNAAATGFFNNMDWNGNYFWSKPPNSTKEIKKQLKTLPKEKYDIGETAKKLSMWVKELDTTRPVTANLILPSASHLSGYTDALDVIGYSYRRVLYDYGHENYRDKPIMGTENLAQYHEWKFIMERPFISGTFLWTGIDYMGEIRDSWPVRVQPSGLLNSAGFKKGSYHMMKTLWNEEPHIHIATQNIEKSLNKLDKSGNIVAKDLEKWKHALWEWQDVNDHWNYTENEMISVEIYSNCDEVELFLNEKSLGRKKLSDFEDHIYKWAVTFKDGTLTAKGVKNGEKISEKIITAKRATKIQLSTEEKTIKANHYDVSHIVLQLTDGNGNPVKTDDKSITFEIDGNAELLGIDNGWKKSVETFYSKKGTTHNGKTLLIIKAKNKTGDVKITAKSDGLESETITIKLI